MKPSRLPQTVVIGSILAVSAALQSGCIVVGAGTAGTGTAGYIRGELHATLNQSLETSELAANKALTQLQFMKVAEKKDAFLAILTARTADDKKVEIDLTKLSSDTTDVQIRVGLFGNEIKSSAILDKIKANL